MSTTQFILLLSVIVFIVGAATFEGGYYFSGSAMLLVGIVGYFECDEIANL